MHATSGKLIDFELISDVLEITDEAQNTVIGPLPSRLPLTVEFDSITFVNITLQDIAGQTPAYVKILDYNATGPLVQAFDSSDVSTLATISFTVRGLPPVP